MLRAGECILHSRTFEKIVSAECRNQHAASVRFPESRYRVLHTHVHSSGSSSAFARMANPSTSTSLRITAKTVEPEPDISAAPTSRWLSNHIFICDRKT